MKTASIVASLSRKAGGLFESVRRLHQSLAELPDITVSVLGLHDEFTDADLPPWKPLRVRAFPVHGPAQFGYAPQLKRALLDADERTRAEVIEAIRPAFDPFVSGADVRFTAACWWVEARALSVTTGPEASS